MDKVFIQQLKVDTIIGIFDWERRVKQTVALDLEMSTDVTKASLSDHIDDAVNYKAVSKRLIQFVGESQFQLVETLAEKVCEIILNEFSVSWVQLRVSKPGAVSHAENVGVIIERGRRIGG